MKPPSFQRDDTVLQSMPSFQSQWAPGVSVSETPVAKAVSQSMDVDNRCNDFEGLGSISLISQTRSRKSLIVFGVVLFLTSIGVLSFLLTNTSDSEEAEELIGPTQQPTTIRELNAELCPLVQSEASVVSMCEGGSISAQCDVDSGIVSAISRVCNNLQGRFCSCEPGQFAEVECPQISDCQDIIKLER